MASKLHRAFELGREAGDAGLRQGARDVVPLSKTYAEQIKELAPRVGPRPSRTAGRESAIAVLFRRVT